MQSLDQHALLDTEKRAITALGLLYSFRMLGLFMLLPVLSLFAADFEGSSPLLIGLALGSYGFTQALFQIPFGTLSDRFGRKPIIVIGLLLFGAGSLIAAGAVSIWTVILGRAVQGSGAISSTVLALLSDLTREEQRTKAMALIGVSIGLTFAIALLIGPWLSATHGVRAVFWLTAVLAVLGLLIVVFVVPTVEQSSVFDGDSSAALHLVSRALMDPELLRLNVGIFTLHFVLTAVFIALPLYLRDTLQLAVSQHGWVYLAVMGTSFVAMIPLLVYAERRQRVKPVFILAIGLLIVSSLLLSVSGSRATLLGGGLFIFFMAFNLLEANLPSLVSKRAFPAGKGTAMGVYSTFQFGGAFLGGVIGGGVMQWGGNASVFVLAAGVATVWFVVALGMLPPVKAERVVLRYDADRFDTEQLLAELAGLPGVEDVTLISEDGLAYLRVERSLFDDESLQRYEALGI